MISRSMCMERRASGCASGLRRIANVRSSVVCDRACCCIRPAKEWPAENYGSLIDLLAVARTPKSCWLRACGAREVRGSCGREQVRRDRRRGHTNIGELIALLSLCDGFIGNDSGCMHLAGVLGIPTVAIFGSTDPNRTGPMGRRRA